MEDCIKTLVDAGASGIVVIVVVLFLRSLDRQTRRWETIVSSYFNQHLAEMKELRQAIDHLSAAK